MVKSIKAIIGANYGDEGKGLMTDYFANEARNRGESCIVVLSNGGAQRGHTVLTPEGDYHVFHHFGSGSFAGADTFFPKQFIVNPMIFCKELFDGFDELYKLNNKIFIHLDCLVSTPFDMLANMIIEESRGDNRHGSVGVGIWETLVRNGKTFKEMYNMEVSDLCNYLKDVREYYEKKLYGLSLRKFVDIFYDENLINNYIRDFKIMCKICTISNEYVLYDYDSIIFENGQGLLLDDSLNDPENGYYTTPSNTGFTNIKDILDATGINYNTSAIDKEVIFVTRSYLTKHGGKDIPGKTEFDFVNKKYESNVHNDYQGDLMYAPMDWNMFFERIRNTFKDIPSNWECKIAVTHCDELDVEVQSSYYKSYGPTRKDVKKV